MREATPTNICSPRYNEDRVSSASQIVVTGAREHNLKNISLTLPRDALIVLTGLSGSGKLSTSTIISIVVGGLAGLAFLAVTLRIVFKCLGRGKGSKMQYQQQPPPIHQQPVYPMNLYSEPYYQQKAESEVTPDDSVSMVSGMPRLAPTLVSNAHGYPPPRY